jgi:PAS domain S-box-containing protein
MEQRMEGTGGNPHSDDVVSFRLLTEKVSDLLSRHTPDGIYRYASPASRQLLGYEPEELIGRPVFELFHPDEMEFARMTHEQLHRSPAPITFTHRIRSKSGEYVWCECRLHAERHPESGEVVEIQAVARDITERKAEQEEREHLIAELKRALESNKVLRGLLSICASCKSIRDENGRWSQIESYIMSRSEAEFSHDLCPACARVLFPEFPE